LPVPGGERAQEQHEAPQGEVEQALAQIWAQVLEVAQVGRHDNFFELGGDSILSIQIKAQAQQQGLQFALEALFERQTVARLAEVVTRSADEAASTLPTVAPFALVDAGVRERLPAGLDDAYPASRMQMALLYHSDTSQDAIVYQDVVCYEVALAWDAATLQQVVDDLAVQHPVLRTSFSMAHGAEPLQLVWKNARMPLTVLPSVRDDAQANRELDALITRETLTAFDWDTAPLCRIHVLPLPAASYFHLCVTFHHAILDGWSETLLIKQLLTRYRQALAGKPPIADGKTLPYREFIALEAAALASQDSRSYWQAQLAQYTDAGLQPADGALGDRAATSRVEREIEISDAVEERLTALAIAMGVPLKSVLLAAHLKVLAVALGRSDVISGVTVNGRPEREGGERTLGLFINTVPMRARLGGERWRDLVRNVFERERETLPHRRFPLAEIVKDCGGMPFDTAFNFTRFHVGEQMYSGEEAPIRDRRGFAATHFACVAEFMVRPGENRLRCVLIFDGAKLPLPRQDTLAALYAQVLAAIAADPDAYHAGWPGVAAAQADASPDPLALPEGFRKRRRGTMPQPPVMAHSTESFQ
ncbi:condensation domain-containing protein, partial [Xanthomonas melonis]|uniref:condensation domain-containing protein n=1 Tax=Xanthomonas melonis TaxID=56456 RepID=UPI003EB75D68